MSAKVRSSKPVQKRKEELVRRRSSDGFTMLLHCQSRLEKLYNQTLRTQVQWSALVGLIFLFFISKTGITKDKQILILYQILSLNV